MCIFDSSNAEPDTHLNGFLLLIEVAHESVDQVRLNYMCCNIPAAKAKKGTDQTTQVLVAWLICY